LSDIEKNVKGSIDNRAEFSHLNEDNIVFVPAENIRIIKQVIDNWEKVKQRRDMMKLFSK